MRWRHQLDGVAPAERAAAGGQRDVDGLLGEDALVALGLELGLAGGERLRDPAAGLADALAGLGLGARRQRADLAVGQGEGALVALVGAAGGLELVERGRGGGGGERLGDGVVDGLRVERRDLDGVVAGVGSRHGVHFGRGWGAPESRWVGARGTDEVWPPGGGADGADAVPWPALSARGRPGPGAR